MKTVMENAPSGFKEGRRVKWGVLSEEVDEASLATGADADAARAALRAEAAASLTNIDAAERERRKLAGSAGAALTLALGAAMVGPLHAGATARLAIFFPAALSFGYLESSRAGL